MIIIATFIFPSTNNPFCNCFILQIILGEVVARKAEVDQTLAYELVDIGRDLPFNVVAGKTVCTNDFYEGKSIVIGTNNYIIRR